MKITCNIIEDLLPLYIDDMVREPVADCFRECQEEFRLPY